MRKLIVVCACLLAPSAGCRKLVSRVIQKAHLTDHAQIPKPVSNETPEEAAMSKYAEGYGKLARPVTNMIDDYTRALSEVKGPPARKPFFVRAGADRDLDAAEKAFQEAKASTPVDRADVTKVAEETLVAARAVQKAFGDAVRYYTSEDYKDDKSEAGRAIDVRMRAGIASYESAAGKLEARLSAIEVERLERELKAIPASKAGYHFRAVNLAADRLMQTRSKPDKLDGALVSVRDADANLRKFVEGHAVPAAFKAYAELALQFESQATAFVRETKEPAKDRKASPSPEAIRLVARHDALIQMGTALRKMEDNGLLN